MISAWLRDITGESNHALSRVATQPLLGTLLARPIIMMGLLRVKRIDLSGLSISASVVSLRVAER